MKIENQVCTLSQSKKLEQLGVTQKSYFQWNISERVPSYLHIAVFEESRKPMEYAAFTVAELSIMLGAFAETYFTLNNKWRCGESADEFDTQAESSADELIKLLELEILSIDAVNHTLVNS